MRTIAVFALGAGVMYVSVRGSDPAAADRGLQNMTAGGSGVATAAGYVAGDALRATGPAIAGAKDAVQSSGIGEMLTPETTLPPAQQPDPEP
jgi:hypothetical protein